jgi:hypothetical protein
MADVVYRSEVRIERERAHAARVLARGTCARAVWRTRAVADHYKVPPDAFPPHATTLDYIVAAAAV